MVSRGLKGIRPGLPPENESVENRLLPEDLKSVPLYTGRATSFPNAMP